MQTYVLSLRITVPPEQAAEACLRHRDRLAELQRSGRLRMAGETGQGEGFVELFDADDRMDAEAIARESPLIAEGLCSWTLREWNRIDFDTAGR